MFFIAYGYKSFQVWHSLILKNYEHLDPVGKEIWTPWKQWEDNYEWQMIQGYSTIPLANVFIITIWKSVRLLSSSHANNSFKCSHFFPVGFIQKFTLSGGQVVSKDCKTVFGIFLEPFLGTDAEIWNLGLEVWVLSEQSVSDSNFRAWILKFFYWSQWKFSHWETEGCTAKDYCNLSAACTRNINRITVLVHFSYLIFCCKRTSWLFGANPAGLIMVTICSQRERGCLGNGVNASILSTLEAYVTKRV